LKFDHKKSIALSILLDVLQFTIISLFTMYIPRLVLLVCLVAVVYAECDVRGLLQAVGSSDFDLVRSFLKQKDCNIDSVDDFYMYTPLFVAVLAGHEEMVKMLVTEYKPNLGHVRKLSFLWCFLSPKFKFRFLSVV
jgi:hypothetical protein